jgi:hypothetical protein
MFGKMVNAGLVVVDNIDDHGVVGGLQQSYEDAKTNGGQILDDARKYLSHQANFCPGVNDIKDVVEFATGQDYIGGDSVGNTGRMFAGVGILFGSRGAYQKLFDIMPSGLQKAAIKYAQPVLEKALDPAFRFIDNTLAPVTKKLAGLLPAARNAEEGVKGASPGPIKLMNKSDQFLINASKRIDIDPRGMLDVVGHGNPSHLSSWR